MSVKIYNKKGNPNYKEKRLLSELEEAFAKKATSDADFFKNFKPAGSYEELQAMHREYCLISDVEPISETKNTDQSGPQDDSDQMKDTNDSNSEFAGQDNPQADPLNRSNPKVREYVLKDNLSPDNNVNQKMIGNTDIIDEPKSHEEAFKLPDVDGESEGKGGDKKQSNGNSEPKEQKQKPLNPQFDDMSGARKNKQTKRFAKNIVASVTMLMEFGYVWWTTKEINETKLAEYELNNDIDLDLLLSLDDTQEQTVKQFFQTKCAKAEVDAKISEEDKEELADALAEVLMEKGIAPTPTQNLIMISLKVLGGQVIKATVANAETNAILSQLRDLKAKEKKKNKAQNIIQHIKNTNPEMVPTNNVAAAETEHTNDPDDKTPDPDPEKHDDDDSDHDDDNDNDNDTGE